MATNRLYLIDTSTKEYLCIAKGGNGFGWNTGNIDLYEEFMSSRISIGAEDPNLILGTESDDDFWSKWIVNGKNYNTENKWE